MRIKIDRSELLDRIREIAGDKYSHRAYTDEVTDVYLSEPLTASETRWLEKVACDRYVCLTYEGQSLDGLKGALMMRIDYEAERRIHEGPGFEYPAGSGQFFSLSKNAQIKWVGLTVGRDAFDYSTQPPIVRTSDDLVEYTIKNRQTVLEMFQAGMLVIAYHLAVCRVAKGAVLAATTEAEAQAAYDAYMGGP